MKKISLLKIIVALCICNAYIFTCGVMGAVGGAPQPREPDIGESDVKTEAHGQGTQDFLSPDQILTPPKTPTASEKIDTLMFKVPSMAQRPVSSTFIPSDLTDKLPVQSSGSESSSSNNDITDYDINIVDTYEPPETSESSSRTEQSVYEPRESSSSSSSSSSSTSSSSSSEPEETHEPSEETSSAESGNTEETSSAIPSQPGEIIVDTTAANEILTVKDYGVAVSGKAIDIISRIVENEIGGTFAPEAIKAQAVAAYSYVKYFNDRGSVPSVYLDDEVSDSVRVLVASVIGEAVYYDGEIIQAVYSASSAGYTASCKNVWGSDLPYLQSVYCELDADYDPNYGRIVTFSASDIKSRVYNTTGITLGDDPSEWIEVEDYVEGKYVGRMNIGGYHTYIDSDGDTVTITGRVFRERIMSFDIRSSAFDVSYDAELDEFTVTTYGYGHGVGLSQNGANNLARYWDYDYKQILEFYYTDAYVG